MRVFVYFSYKEYHSIRKWIQRHPEYSGSIFSNDGFYIAKFDIDATDAQKVAYFFKYFANKNVEIFKMKKLAAWEILRNFEIVSFRPFIARAKSQGLGQNPGSNTKASDGLLENVRPDGTNHDEQSPHLFSGPGRVHPVRNPSLGTGEGQPSPSVLKGVEER